MEKDTAGRLTKLRKAFFGKSKSKPSGKATVDLGNANDAKLSTGDQRANAKTAGGTPTRYDNF
jgi:hypothetical protein